jgi:hypothetical protein
MVLRTVGSNSKKQADEKNVMMMYFAAFTQYYYGDQIKEKVSETCSTHGRMIHAHIFTENPGVLRSLAVSQR